MSTNSVLQLVITFLIEGGVFKINDKYVVFSNDLLLCELTDVVEDNEGIKNHGDIVPSEITFNQFVISCMNLTKQSLENIYFTLNDGVTEC